MTERALHLEPGSPWPLAGSWDRLYCGAEFCPWLLPTPAEARAALEEARSRGLAFTLVTPFLTRDVLEQARDLLEGMTDEAGMEVVVNDWGLLGLMEEAGWPVRPVLGRLLVKGSAAPAPGGAAAGYLETNNLHSSRFLDFIGNLGIGRVETDCFTLPPAGFARKGFAASFHHPYGFVTLAARCPWRFDGRRWTGGPCPGPCRRGAFHMVRVEDGVTLTVQGRAQEIQSGELPGDPAARGIDRFVEHPVFSSDFRLLSTGPLGGPVPEEAGA